MLNVGNNEQIIFTKGDTVVFSLFVNDGTELDPHPYEFIDRDKIVFAILSNNRTQEFNDAELTKIYINDELTEEEKQKDNIFPLVKDDNNVIIRLDPEDTAKLRPGTYYYQIKLYTKNKEDIKEVHTITDRTKIEITL